MDGGETDIWAARLARALQESAERMLADTSEAAVAFSGGLDSSVVALLVSRLLEKTALYTVGLPGARDLFTSKRTVEALGLDADHVRIEVDEKEVLAAAAEMLRLIPQCEMTEAAFLMPSYLVFLHSRETTVLTGDGADELFGGYHRYLAMDAAGLASSLRADTQWLLGSGIARNRLLAKAAGKELGTLFLADDIVELSQKILPEHKVRDGHRKLVLRRAAEILGVPPEVSNLPKTAAQYGSSVMKVLRKHPGLFQLVKR